MRGEFIDVGGTRLYYYASGTRGAGEPLLLVHGFPASSHLWARVVPLLPAGYRAIVPDLLGYGRSDPAPPNGPAADVTVAGHARRMMRLLDVLGVERAGVIGHGIGAAVALDMWRAQPLRVTRLGLVNPIESPCRATGPRGLLAYRYHSGEDSHQRSYCPDSDDVSHGCMRILAFTVPPLTSIYAPFGVCRAAQPWWATCGRSRPMRVLQRRTWARRRR